MHSGTDGENLETRRIATSILLNQAMSSGTTWRVCKEMALAKEGSSKVEMGIDSLMVLIELFQKSQEAWHGEQSSYRKFFCLQKGLSPVFRDV